MKKSEESIPDRVKKGSAPILERLNALDKDQLHAVLATESDGQPYTSMIAYALTPDKKGIVFITPQKTRKYKNILKNNKVSLLIDTRSNTEKDYMSAESLTILGNAKPVRKGGKWSELAGVLILKHPNLNEIIHSPETKLIFVQISRCIHVTRFQTVSEWISR
ncbi:MAG: pyridoxamine 5'-phosphate oxidase family protein [Thermodesulfovibrionales bacterium]|nr:pyridoxamine 5'-phosphate oxidase family protein [Thermodesulfovibrionales bacterium]